MPPPRASAEEVLPPSRRGETAGVVRAAVAIAIVALFWIASARRRAGGTDPADALQSYQVRFADLAPAMQRVVRELQEGTIEAMRLRAEAGKWPAAARLAADGIPPFADDGADRGVWRWSSHADRLAFQYLGVTKAGAAERSLLLSILEPAAGDTEGRDPRQDGKLDETHKRLADGTLLHVTIWIEGGGVPPEHDALIGDPAMEGWQQVVTREAKR